MKKLILVIFTCGAVLSPAAAIAQMTIWAEDGQFLGAVNSDRFDEYSICNRFSEYGCSYGDGIFSTYGAYGKRSVNSAYDPNATKPPRLKLNNRTIGRVTINPRIRNGYSPDYLRVSYCPE